MTRHVLPERRSRPRKGILPQRSNPGIKRNSALALADIIEYTNRSRFVGRSGSAENHRQHTSTPLYADWSPAAFFNSVAPHANW
ncbi:hypothetical protein PUN28_011187 [Cardiocondyla obscurior]|uniref:Uncharacterized protein n=1 Tax=Cardiocondyla obscurior TaxID=286306 RepID=A0AAW2FQM9_9HYME